MKAFRYVPVLLIFAALASVDVRVASRPADQAGSAPFFAGISDPASLQQTMDARLARARQALDRLAALQGRRTIENTLRPYDAIVEEASAAGGQARVIASTHPDERMRQTAEKVVENVSAFSSELSLNRKIYDALSTIDVSRADPETAFYLQRELRGFRLSGVDKDEATRQRLRQLQNDLSALVQQFMRNIRSSGRVVPVRSAAELDGLPADFVARHQPAADGSIALRTDDADVRPVLTFATREDVRRRMYMEWTNVGYPANIDVLDRMIATRGEIARLLGYESWAAYDMVDRMSGSVNAVSDFIDRIVEASGPGAAREYDELLKRKKRDVPDAKGVTAWENTYYAELVRKANYDFDSQSVRAYFPFDRVRQGLFDVTGRLFGVTYRPAKDAPVWHPSVEAYEMLENGTVIGRFYLDMHPRPDKDNNGAHTATVRTGMARRQLPEAVLVASVSGGQPGDPGLMTHDEVRTFFHEFGHLVHALVSGRHQWAGVGGISTERDFVEAPSQMLEEWTWDPATLATFARHYQTAEPIPVSLVNQLRRANEFGKALGVRQQMIFAKLSLSLHDRDPKTVDSTAILRELQTKYVPFPYVEGTHRQTSFPHLSNRNYSASYYTYMWSLVIAKDLFSQFDAKNLLAPDVARRYRDRVLVPGGSKPAAALVHDFLGRPFSATAWQGWLNRDPS